jgi:NADH-quinone oxidoreductase subunit I
MPDIGSSHRQTAGLPAVWSSIWSLIQGLGVVLSRTFRRPITVQYPEEQPYLPPRWRGRIVLTRDPDGEERCVACYLCAAACPVDCIALQATESPDQHDRRYPAWFRINFSRCIYCGHCEEACPTYAIQLTPDFEQGEYERRNMVYEKQDLLISGTGKYPDYNFYRVAGVRIGGKEKGEAENEQPPVDVRSLLP